MTARKLLVVFLFTSCAAFLLGAAGYYLFWREETQPATIGGDNTVTSVARAENELRTAVNRGEEFARLARQARNEANAAKTKVDQLEEKKPKPPETGIEQARAAQQEAERKADQAESRARDAGEKVEQSRSNLDAARAAAGGAQSATNAQRAGHPQPGLAQRSSEGESGNDSILPLLSTTFSALALFFVLLLFWWTLELKKDTSATTEEFANILLKKQSDKFASLSTAVSGLQDVTNRLSRLQSEVSQLRESLTSGHQERLAERGRAEEADHSYNAIPAVQPDDGPPVGEYAAGSIDFPISANSFLMRLGGQQQVVKPDPLKGILVNDPEGRGQFVLARDGSVPGGQLCIVPRTSRFQATEDFYNHYEQFYDCHRPTAGEVWVNWPAVVESVDGGWKLRERGELEVK